VWFEFRKQNKNPLFEEEKLMCQTLGEVGEETMAHWWEEREEET